MQSSGGSISARAAAAQPVKTILSGPAGGVVGAFAVASAAGFSDVITLDMGGTSTDVALCPGHIQETAAATVGELPVSVPLIDIHTVGAGGGSIARVDAGGALLVGPESAGADPGPACYGRGKEATVTDANLALGRMDPSYFLGGRMALDPGRARRALMRLASAMGLRSPHGDAAIEQAAAGVVRVVNAAMERALRTISLERGFDPRRFTLVAFGGAGPQHACELAQELHIPRVLVPLFPGALSAYGVAIADVVKDYSRTVLLAPEALTRDALAGAFAALEAQGRGELRQEGVSPARIELRRLLEMRYAGQSYELTVECPPLRRQGARGKRQGAGDSGQDMVAREAVRRFHQAHQQRFGYADERQPVELVNVRLQAVGLTEKPELGARGQESGTRNEERGTRSKVRRGGPRPLEQRKVFFEGRRLPTAFYLRPDLGAGESVTGPAVLLQEDATTVIPPGWAARVDGWGNLIITQSREVSGGF
jgi:N-methylhydantoinase A